MACITDMYVQGVQGVGLSEIHPPPPPQVSCQGWKTRKEALLWSIGKRSHSPDALWASSNFWIFSPEVACLGQVGTLVTVSIPPPTPDTQRFPCWRYLVWSWMWCSGWWFWEITMSMARLYMLGELKTSWPSWPATIGLPLVISGLTLQVIYTAFSVLLWWPKGGG